ADVQADPKVQEVYLGHAPAEPAPTRRRTQQRHRWFVVQAAAKEHLSPLGERAVPQLTETPDDRWDCERLIG
ncbi:hypothetical protein AB0Q90_14130, partial [Streptomyces sp. NPDC079141]|uniref:ABC transporter ATP-binding protein C-terminal domain-containing protein n=1 Tax=Streptomyces sp. NPDC079141 TaxID=3155056 RepID=UPI00342EE9A6